jgi:hypothetical protein
VGAELVALDGVEGAFEEGAEDGGFDVAPVGAGGFEEEVDLVAVEREDGGSSKRPPLNWRMLARRVVEKPPRFMLVGRVRRRGGRSGRGGP